MSLVDSVERKFLFGFTRVVALFFISLAVLTIVGCAIFALSQIKPDSISLSHKEILEIVDPNERITPNNTENSTVDNQAEDNENIRTASRTFPFAIQKTFNNPASLEKLEMWLDTFSEKDQDQIITELEEVIKLAEEKNSDIDTALMTFQKIKMEKARSSIENQQSKSLENSITAGIVGLSIVIVALFSLVLVLLAIERNTRKV